MIPTKECRYPPLSQRLTWRSAYQMMKIVTASGIAAKMPARKVRAMLEVGLVDFRRSAMLRSQ